jgi:hypothetical protein
MLACGIVHEAFVVAATSWVELLPVKLGIAGGGPI